MFVFWRIYLKRRYPHFMSHFFGGIYVGGPKMDLKDPRALGISGCAMYMSPKPTKRDIRPSSFDFHIFRTALTQKTAPEGRRMEALLIPKKQSLYFGLQSYRQTRSYINIQLHQLHHRCTQKTGSTSSFQKCILALLTLISKSLRLLILYC